MALALLVEQGVVGLFLFASLLLACAWTIVGLPSPERKLWAVLMLGWLVGVMSIDWQYDKITWLLFGLLAAQSARSTRRSAVVNRTSEPAVLSRPPEARRVRSDGTCLDSQRVECISRERVEKRMAMQTTVPFYPSRAWASPKSRRSWPPCDRAG